MWWTLPSRRNVRVRSYREERGRFSAVGLFILCAAVIFTIARPSLSHETLTTTVYFDREIVRILDKHCVMCHNEKGPSFPLETYEQTWLAGRKIRTAVIARHMPPWAAVPGYGEFANENNLTLREVQFLVSWVEGLGPRNGGTVFTNVANSSAPREPVRAKWEGDVWKRGVPDMMLNLDPASIPGGAGNTTRRIVVATGLKTAQPIRAIDYMLGDARLVRAVFFTIQETGQWIGSWTPWYGSMESPANAAFRLPPNAHIVAEVHYTSGKVNLTERGKVGLFLADKTAVNTVSDMTVSPMPSPKDGRFRAEVVIERDMHVIALRLDPQGAASSVEVSERMPNGQTHVLLFAKDFVPDWPSPFIFKTPALLHRGSKLTITSHGNPAKVTLSRY